MLSCAGGSDCLEGLKKTRPTRLGREIFADSKYRPVRSACDIKRIIGKDNVQINRESHLSWKTDYCRGNRRIRKEHADGVASKVAGIAEGARVLHRVEFLAIGE